MKKHIFFAAFVAVTGLMTSCSNDDELSSTDSQVANAIAFSTDQATTPLLSRSGETLTSLSKFTVTAVGNDKSLYFDGETFNYTGGVFKSSVSHYWPTTGSLSFYAISDPGTKSLDANNVPSYTYTNWAGQKDLVAATAIGGTKQIPFPLTFQHVTSQVQIGAEAENKTEELTYKLTTVTMTTPSSGTYNFDTVSGCSGTWSIDNTKTSTYSFKDALPMSFAQNATNKLDNCYWNILPVKDGKITFRVEYQVLQNGKVISDFTGSNYKEVIVDKPNLMSGKVYTYNFILTRSTADEIRFVTSVADWSEGTSASHIPDRSLAENTAVDLGLSVKWAKGNLGAETETDFGLYYAWGETTGYAKDGGHEFSMDNYTAGAINANLAGNNDAAIVKLGGAWRMPTQVEFNELLNNTNKSWTTINGVSGYKFTNKSDESKYIFLPAAGYYNELENNFTSGYYLTSTYSSSTGANFLLIDQNMCTMVGHWRYYGYSVRGVCQ